MYVIVIDNIITKTGTLKQLIGRINPQPQCLSEEELKALDVYLAKPFDYELKVWEVFGESTYIYDEDLDIVREIKEIKEVGLEAFKANKLAEIKATYEQIQTEGFTATSGIKIDCKPENVNDFANGKLLLDVSGATGSKVTDFNNDEHNLSAEQYTMLVLELGGYITKLRSDKGILRNLVNACLDYESVYEIYWRNPIFDDMLFIIDYEYNVVL